MLVHHGGQAFVDSLRARVGTRSVGVYPVDYPASTDFRTALDGISDASAHVRSVAATCPNTQMVLGGFSQGAAVMGFVTANVIPDGAPDGVPNPMPPDVADHVAAVALFGKPNDRFMRAIREPQIAVGPLYAAKTIDLCVPDDPICSRGTDFNKHMQYAETGMVDQAATFTASRVLATLCSVPHRRNRLLLPHRNHNVHRLRRAHCCSAPTRMSCHRNWSTTSVPAFGTDVLISPTNSVRATKISPARS